MPSAWHTPEDPREYGSPVLELACDTPGCVGVVRIAADDWHDNDAYYCHGCVLAILAAPYPVALWLDTLPADDEGTPTDVLK